MIGPADFSNENSIDATAFPGTSAHAAAALVEKTSGK
jgi:hypothetical protein